MRQSPIQEHNVILFQGDSITDAGRSRYSIGANHPDGLGYGYPRLIADRLLADYPDHHLQIYNRGISGDRIRDLAHRWPNDSLRLLPDLVSILIGVNDTWNYLFMGLGSDPGGYGDLYRQILQNTLEVLPNPVLVLCEPFLLPVGEVNDEWMDDIRQRQEILKELCDHFQAIHVPFQSALDQASQVVPPHRLLEDGVHPTAQGHQILADCWLEAVINEK